MEEYLLSHFGSSGSGFTSQDTVFGSIAFVIVLIIALLHCFLGYKLQKVWITVVGFFVGLVLGSVISGFTIGSKVKPFVIVLIGLAAGIIIGFVAFKLYTAGVFIWIAGLTFVMVTRLFTEKYETVAIVVGIVAAILFGILAVVFMRSVIIALTAINGGFTAVTMLMEKINFDGKIWILIMALVLTALGMAVQFMTTKDKKMRA